MKAKLLVNNREIEVEITEEEFKKLEEKSVQKTGYERVEREYKYFYAESDGAVDDTVDLEYEVDDGCYDTANYYSDKTIAENNARADQLMRQLRRFAVEHRKEEIKWESGNYKIYDIQYYYPGEELRSVEWQTARVFNGIYFDCKETAYLAIETFRDELIWYFTEYKDSLKG